MIHHTANNREFLLVEVPRGIATGADSIITQKVGDSNFLIYWIKTGEHKAFYTEQHLRLPKDGTYSIFCMADKATPEQAKEVVEFSAYSTQLYRDYMGIMNGFPMAVDALQSLSDYHFPNTDNRVLIIEKM